MFYWKANEQLSGWDIFKKDAFHVEKKESDKRIATFYDEKAAITFANLLNLEEK